MATLSSSCCLALPGMATHLHLNSCTHLLPGTNWHGNTPAALAPPRQVDMEFTGVRTPLGRQFVPPGFLQARQGPSVLSQYEGICAVASCCTLEEGSAVRQRGTS